MKTCPACLNDNSDGTATCSKCGYSFDKSVAGSEKTRMVENKITDISTGNMIANRYIVKKELGRGGMGVVYLTRDIELRNIEVALKVIHPSLVSHDEALNRFVEEVIISQRLTHQNIVKVYDLKRWQDLRFFTMEYMLGRSLREWIDLRKDKMPLFNLQEIISVFNPLLDALSYAHQFTVHRDIKPENIIVSGEFHDVSVKVLDFGIAKTFSPSRFSMTAQAMGTAYYMAPEQMTGADSVDHRADLFSVGMILYEMLTGKMAVGRFRLPGEFVDDLPTELPTEAEWEYAARAGTSTPFAFGSCLSTDQDNYDGNYPLSGCPKGIYRKKTLKAASFQANPWGLYDMHGNVREWCQDWYGNYPNGSVTNPKSPSGGSLRVIRGGSWHLHAGYCRSAYRNNGDLSGRSLGLGFRLARTP